MRFVAPLDEIIHGRVALRVLRMLCLFPTKEFTGRELAREAHVPPSNGAAELARLLQYGLVRCRTVGRANLWCLVPEHILVRGLMGMFDAERGARAQLRGDLASVLRTVPGVDRAVLFGSVARGDERPTSDVDLLVVLRDKSAKAALAKRTLELRQSVRRRYGNRLQIIPYTREEWRSRKGAELIHEIEAEGQLVMGN